MFRIEHKMKDYFNFVSREINFLIYEINENYFEIQSCCNSILQSRKEYSARFVNISADIEL